MSENPYPDCQVCEQDPESRAEHTRFVDAIRTDDEIVGLDNVDSAELSGDENALLIHGHTIHMLTGALDFLGVDQLAERLFGSRFEEVIPSPLADNENSGIHRLRSAKLLAIDPPTCGCTECLVGEYMPEAQASREEILEMLHGRLGNHTYTRSVTLLPEGIRAFGHYFSYSGEVSDLDVDELISNLLEV